jgi:two-component sensor histidine kinase
MTRWSLRAKLVAAIFVALLPAIILAGWSSYEDIVAERARHAEAVYVAIERAVARHREIIEGSRRLVTAACSDDIVQRGLDPAATPADIGRCESYLSGMLRKFPSDYSAMVVTDAQGVVRCSTTPDEVGMSFTDRQIFRVVRENKGVSIGSFDASRVVPHTVIPMAMPVTVDGQFRGMCSLGISLKPFAELATAEESGHPIPIVLIDRSGAPVGGNAEMIFTLPVAARLTAAIAKGETRFRDYGQDGSFSQFFVVPLAGNAIYAVAALSLTMDVATALREGVRFALIALTALIVLAATWFGADRWCARPLGYIGDFAARAARGEDVRFVGHPRWTAEFSAVGDSVKQMAEAITSRESALRDGLEQRDHMLREIHHRVKNNLQMISSLLNLQAGEIRSPRIRRFFGDAQNRVLTLSILHRHLYERSSWSLVDFQQFISDLVRQISVSRTGIERPSVRFHIRAPIMAVGPDTAIPVGLIVTEAVSSALSHDFGSIAAPEIRIEAVEKGGEEVELVIEDNGIDASDGAVGPNVRGTFGATLIRGLAMQLGGEVRVSGRNGGGTRVVVTFPMASEADA